MVKKTFLLIFLLFPFITLYSENVVGSMNGLLIVQNDQETSTVEVGLEDLASVDYLYDNPFVQGVELIFSIPEDTRNFRNSFALYLYRSVSPRPAGDQSQYRGSQFFMQILPYTAEFSLKVPFTKDHTLRKDADSVVTAPVDREAFPLLLTLLPISKGLPDIARSASVSLKAIPLYENRGGLKIEIESRDELSADETKIRIDGSEKSWPEEYYPLSPGFHTVEIENPATGRREFTIAVEAGKFTKIHHVLQSAVSRLFFAPREGVSYLLDGEEIPPGSDGISRSCEPGIHLIGIRLNEKLILTEEYNIQPGENLTISLDARILFEKN